jgi:hypothetical protein
MSDWISLGVGEISIKPSAPRSTLTDQLRRLLVEKWHWREADALPAQTTFSDKGGNQPGSLLVEVSEYQGKQWAHFLKVVDRYTETECGLAARLRFETIADSLETLGEFVIEYAKYQISKSREISKLAVRSNLETLETQLGDALEVMVESL